VGALRFLLRERAVVIFYMGHTSDRKIVSQVRERPQRMGFLVQRGYSGRYPIHEGIRWAYDNGAYSDFIHSREFDAEAFREDLTRFMEEGLKPNWVVLPDIVQGGPRSLEHSLRWLEELPRQFPYLIAVQDGMTREMVEPHMKPIRGLFVGGSSEFKATLPEWCQLAHDHGKICHLGRSSSINRILWAKVCEADSCDSSFFNWTRDRVDALLEFIDAGYVTRQQWFDFFNVQPQRWEKP